MVATAMDTTDVDAARRRGAGAAIAEFASEACRGTTGRPTAASRRFDVSDGGTAQAELDLVDSDPALGLP